MILPGSSRRVLVSTTYNRVPEGIRRGHMEEKKQSPIKGGQEILD